MIRNLLSAVADAPSAKGLDLRLAHKGDGEESDGAGAIRAVGDNAEALRILQSGEVNVLGGTAWLWARLEFAKVVDVLFLDEAGQMSLPYNAQVSRLAERLAATGVRAGPVDKFQGQQAPVVIYSMATSRPEDAPRRMGSCTASSASTSRRPGPSASPSWWPARCSSRPSAGLPRG